MYSVTLSTEDVFKESNNRTVPDTYAGDPGSNANTSNDGEQFKEDLIRPTKLNMAAKFVEHFIFLRGIGERNDVQNLNLLFIY